MRDKTIHYKEIERERVPDSERKRRAREVVSKEDQNADVSKGICYRN